MKGSPIAALTFLVGLILIPAALTYGFVYGVLRISDKAVLFYREEVQNVQAANHDASSDEAKDLRCWFFSGNGVVERKFSHEELSYEDTGFLQNGSCPFWIDAS